MNTAHRAGPLKQQNKGHKTGGHRSKGAVAALNRGRISSASSGGIKKVKKESKVAKKNKMKQLRQLKYEHILELKKGKSTTFPPELVAVIPLVPYDKEFSGTLADLSAQDPGDWIFNNGFIQSPQKFKRRFHFVQPNVEDIHAVLDVTKVCDAVVYIIGDSVGVNAEKLIYSIAAQGLPSSPTFVIDPTINLDMKKALKPLKKWIDSICPTSTDKIFTLQNAGQVVQLLRHLGDQRKMKNSLKATRSHLMVENVDCVPDGATSTVKLTGYVRGVDWNVNRIVHVPGWGDFQLEKAEKHADPHSAVKKDSMVDLSTVFPTALQDDMITENEPDMMDGEQTWPTEEELNEAETKKKVIRVPKGTSEYQAAWIIDNDDNQNDDPEDSDSESENSGEDLEDQEGSEEDNDMEDDYDEETEELESDVNEPSDNYDAKHVSFADEQNAYEKLKKARMDEMFPDEIDTPQGSLAKDRFQKYRGLKSFRSSPWDPKENLPFDYGKVFQFENFKRTKKSVMKANDEENESLIPMGTYVSLVLKNVPSHFYADFMKNPVPLVAFCMLKHEQRMSVMNVAVKRFKNDINHEAIASKEKLIFHVGYRRFAASPVFSAHTNGDKHKYERYWRPEDPMIVMTMFAPIMYPPSNVLVFRELASGRQSLVGSGHLVSMDPDRLVIKRVVLSGHPFKVHKRTAVVRFMFFNRQDIEWFKPVELRSKYGRRGHIKEPLGTHGHMKIILDKPVTQQDTILMNLYKRVFPKWNYDPYVNRWTPGTSGGHKAKDTSVQFMEQ